MKNAIFLIVFIWISVLSLRSQNYFPYDVKIEKLTVANFPGLHSFVFAQQGDKVVLIGGRTDGLHARQPFSSFLATNNNTNIYVFDLQSHQLWSASINSLPTALKEQLQSTNMNFYQDQDTLVIIGGYAYAASASDHITFPYLTTIQVSGLIQAIVSNSSISPYFQQITNANFAVTGGQLGKIGDIYYLVGGQKFTGRYNPMGGSTFTQAYTNAIRKFKVHNSSGALHISDYSSVQDAVHLHRRDYNLVPQVFPDGSLGYTISAGVFQTAVDLPFLYPVDIKANGYFPQTNFNQYLSHYHSAKVSLYDSLSNTMHSLFFGGMSQYYYQNGTLIQDNQVPFVKTISKISRDASGNLSEAKWNTEMPVFVGSGAEFIPNHNLSHYENEVVKIHDFQGDTLDLGYIIGGIESPVLNAFSTNQSSITSASTSIYRVKLVKNLSAKFDEISGGNPVVSRVFPNPATDAVFVDISGLEFSKVHYFISNTAGQLLQQGEWDNAQNSKEFVRKIPLKSLDGNALLFLHLVVDGKFYKTHKIIRR